MGETWDLQVRIAKNVLILNFIINIIVLIGSFFFKIGVKEFAVGNIFGVLIAILNFRLLALTTEKAVTLPPNKAQTYAGFRYVVRYTITIAVLFIALKADYINALGTVIGLISIKPVVLREGISGDKNFFKKIFIKNKRKEEN